MSKEIESQSRVLEEGDDALVKGTVGGDTTADGEAEIVYASLEETQAQAEAEATAAAAAAKLAAKPAAKPAAASADDELPAEYRGKSIKEIAQMHREAQSLIGRQGSELGDLRSKVDIAIQASLASLAHRKAEPAAAVVAPVVEEFDDSKFFAQPRDTISKMIENHPTIKKIFETLGKSEADTATARATAATERFNQTHPDAAEILKDPEFRTWVNASKVRQRLLHQAHTRFDFDAGDEVLGTWKALKGVRTSPTPASGDTAVTAAAKTLAAAKAAKTLAATQAAAAAAAAVPSGGGSSAGKPGGGKKIYRRADVLKLMEENPERYEALADELSLAYRENRVR